MLTFFLNVVAQNTPPVLTNFRVENNQPSRIYFDSSMPISGTSTTGFTVSGKSISGVNVASNATSGHYFTISSPFNFWDNNTIRYEGGSNLKSGEGVSLNEMTLTYVENRISEPSGNGNTYYVSTGGSDSNNGLSSGAAWKTITHAAKMAKAGDIVYIKAGNYGNENVVCSNSGTPTSPIKFIGYKSSPGDITSNYYNPATENWSSSEMPTITGTSRTVGTAFTISGKSNIIVKNIQASTSLHGFWLYRHSNVFIENCNAKSFGTDAGQAFACEGLLTGNNYNDINTRFIGCVAKNACDNGMSHFGNHELIKNCTIYQDEGATTTLSMDYYLVFRGNHNMAVNNYVKRANSGVGHTGYVGIKSGEDNGQRIGSVYNLFANNKIYGIGRSLLARNSTTNFNVFKNNYVEGLGTKSGGGIAIFGGVKGNIWEGNTIKNVKEFIQIWGNSEDAWDTNKTMENNIIRNNTFHNASELILGQNDDWISHTSFKFNNNKFYNNTFVNVERYFYTLLQSNGSWTMSGNTWENNIFYNIKNYKHPETTVNIGFTYDTNNFFNNGFGEQGTNVINSNPQFVDINSGNFRLKPESPLIDKGKAIQGVKFDLEGNHRPQGKSIDIGAFEFKDKSTSVIEVKADAGKDVSICAGSSTVLTASGGSSYTWSNGASGKSITVSPDKTTTYTVTVSEGSSTATDEVVVTVNALPLASAGSDVSIEAGQSTTLTASGGDTYVWSTGETTPTITVKPTTSTVYEVKVSKSGCESTATATVTVNNGQPVTGLTADAGKDVTICAGDNAVLNASGGTGYTWSNGASGKTITVSPDKTTSYTVTVTDGTNTATDEVLVIVNPMPVASAGSDVTIEAGQSTTLTASGGDKYVWSTGETTASINVIPATTTIYEVKVTKNGCESTASVKVTVNSAPSIPVVNADAGNDITICKGSSAVLTASGGSSYIWSKGERTKSIMVSPDVTTTYAVTVSNGIVSQTDNVTVFVKELPVADAGADITIEEGQSATLSASGGDSYLWNTGETTKSITVNPKASTSYTVKVFQNGCESTDKVQVIVKEVPPAAANAGSDITICKGESITLKGDGGTTYSWSTGASSQNITVNPTRTTTYTLTANRGGTTNSDEVTVTVINCDLNNGVNNSVSGTTGNPATNDTAEQDDSQILNKADFELTVYPNPTEGKLNVQTTIPIYNFNLVLMNINGNIIYADEMDASEDGIKKEIDLSRMAKGVYFLQLYNEEESYVKKIMVI